MNAPATSAEFAAHLNPDNLFDAIDLAGRKAVIAAVSGGSDSLALLLLLKQFFDSKPSPPQLIAVTIDHDLRPGSDGEALDVASLCDRLGLGHRILKWEGPKPVTGISAAAREMRYALLARAANDAGTDIVLTGHTMEDQIETHVMRAQRGAGRGLAAMAPATLLGGKVWLLRPLLGTARADLRQCLVQHGIVWSDDPTNEKTQFERVRIRKAMTGERGEAALSSIEKHVSLRRALNIEASELLRRDFRMPQPGLVTFDRRFGEGFSSEAQQLALAVVIAGLGGRRFIAAEAEVSRALAYIRDGSTTGRINLERCIVQKSARENRIFREQRNLPKLTVLAGEQSVWDDRYRVENCSPVSVKVTARGEAGMREYMKTGMAEQIYRPAVLAMPVFAPLEEGPDLKKIDALQICFEPHLAIFDYFLSGHDIDLANTLAGLFGRNGYPKSPLA